MPIVPINYLAVLIAAIAPVIIGFLWFGPLFGKKWMALMGWENMPPEKMAEGRKKMPRNAAIQFVGALFMAFILAHALIFAESYLHVSGIGAGLMVGFMNWLGFVAPVTIGMVLWEGKQWSLWML